MSQTQQSLRTTLLARKKDLNNIILGHQLQVEIITNNSMLVTHYQAIVRAQNEIGTINERLLSMVEVPQALPLNKVVVTISATAGAGKTAVGQEIAEMLMKAGWNTHYTDQDDTYRTPETHAEAVKKMKDRTVIIIDQKSLARQSPVVQSHWNQTAIDNPMP